MSEFQKKQCGSIIIEKVKEDEFWLSHVGRKQELRLDRDDLKDMQYLLFRALEDYP